MAVEKMRKGKRKFERKRKIYKLCRQEIYVTQELKIVRLLLQIKVLFVLLAIYLDPDDSNQGRDLE